MKFLTFILCLASLTVFGAVPDYKSFKGTGGIIVASNPPTGLIVIDGSGIPGGSATNAQPPSAVLSNIVNNSYYGYTNAASDGSTKQFGSSVLTNLSAFYTNIINLNASSNISFAISNAPSGSAIYLACDRFPVTPSIQSSNGLGAINIFNKTNIAIIGVPGCSVIDGGLTLGTLINVSNVDGFIMMGVTVKGYTLTNFTLFTAAYGWGSFEYSHVQNLLLFNNRFIEGFDHGVIDRGANLDISIVPSTNNIVIRGNYFDNFGSQRANISVATDGTAIVPTGGTIEDNVIVNCYRGIEPYSQFTTIVVNNCFIRRNTIRNMLEDGITTAGSTNIHGIVADNNHISWDLGYTRRGTNVMAVGCGVTLNGGQRHVLRGNLIMNPPNFGINLQSVLETFGYVLDENVIRGQFTGGSSGGGGIGFYNGDNGVYPMRGFRIHRNTIQGMGGPGIQLAVIRDSSVTDNDIINCGTNGVPMLQFYTSAGHLISNVVASGNWMRYNELAAGPPSALIDISAQALAVTLIGNKFDGSATPIVNNAGAGVKYVQQLDALGNVRNDITNTFTALRLSQQGTNKFLWLDAGSNIVAGTIGSGLSLAAGTLSASGGGGSLTTNANQFGASVVLTLKDGVRVTNAVDAGSFQALGSVTGSGFNTTEVVTQNRALYFDGSSHIAESSATATELGYLAGVTSAIQVQLSNDVRVAAGPNITVTPSGAGGVMTYTVAGSAGGAGFAALEIQTNGTRVGLGTNINFTAGITGSFSGQTFTLGAIGGSGGGNYSTNADGSASFIGTGVGALRLYDNAQTEYSQAEAPFDIVANNVTRWFSNSLAGVVVGQAIGTGTNQAQRIPLTAGQYVTFNGTTYVSSNLPTYGNFSTNVTDGSATLSGTGGGLLKLFDNAAARYFLLGAPPSVTSNTVWCGPSNALSGVVLSRNVAVGTNQLLTAVDGAGMFTNNGSGVYGWMAIPSGGGSGGTNYPFIQKLGAGTNIAVGVGVRQSFTISTNASFRFFFTGSPSPGEHISLGVSNASATTIFLTNNEGIFDTTLGSNVTTFSVLGSSRRFFEFVNNTNWNLGTNLWEMRDTQQKEFELAAAGGLVLHTNAAQSIVTVSNYLVNAGNFGTNSDGTAIFQGQNTTGPLVTIIGTNVSGASTNVGLILTNNDAALSGVQKYSPIIQQWGNGWKTTATAGSQPIGVQMQVEPSEGTTTPQAIWTLRFGTNISGANLFGANAALTVFSSGSTVIRAPAANTYTIGSGAGNGFTVPSAGQIIFSGRTIVENGSGNGGELTLSSSSLVDFYALRLGGKSPTNGLIRFESSSIGTSNGTVTLRSGNTNVWLNFGAQNIGTHDTNWTADVSSFVGFTNTTAYNQIWNIRGTSGNIVFWNRSGLAGATVAGVAIWTNTIIASGSDIVVGVNCGLAIDTGVGVVGGGRAF